MNRTADQQLFTAPFMRKYGLKPFPVDVKTMDIEDGQFLQDLSDSVRSGYDMSRPIIVAKSEDERIDGQIIDGRHRVYVLAKLQEQRVPLPSPFPLSFVEVRDANHLRALIAQYESKGRSKAGKYAKAHIDLCIKAIVDDKYKEVGDGIFTYIQSLGFSNSATIADVVESVREPNSRKHRKIRQEGRPSAISSSLPPHLTSRWTDPSDVYAKKGERFDTLISYHKCPDGHPLKITTDLTGRVLKVEAAPTIQN